MKKMASRSRQAHALQKKLTVWLLLAWLAFTVGFCAVAFAANALIVPRLAQMVADSTSEWIYWDKSEYPLSTCLRTFDGHLLATADSWQDVEEMDRISQEAERRGTELSQGSSTMSSDELMHRYIEGATSDLIGYEDIDAIPSDIPLLVSIGGAAPQWRSIDSLRRDVVEYKLSQLHDRASWQYFETDSTIELRNLHTYYMLRDLKVPLFIALYMIGCVIIVLVGYGRAIRYFDELSGAVAGMLEDRAKPVKLSDALVITQDELNGIRLASLADERAAEAAEKRKDELVAYLAHDIKTPLTSVMGYLMLLDEAPDLPDDMRKRYICIASEKTERLEELIDEFFEITRYNLHSIPIERENVDLLVLVGQVVEEFFPVCEAKGITIEVDVPEGSVLFVDPSKIARVLGNVVRNAVAYAQPDSTIDVVGRRSDDGEHWSIAITNRGKEISDVHLKSIFEKFYRADGSRSSESGGSGLGLAIAKEIVDAHGGSIEAASVAGETTFTIELPQ